MKIVYTGLESSGKSLKLSRMAEDVRIRNIRWYKKTKLRRTMCFNSPMSEAFKKQLEKSNINYLDFKNLDDILYLEECDIFVDELIKFFPASQSSLSTEQLHFITQGAKSGINVYASSQDFSQVHKQFRLLTNRVFVITKVIGSKRPMKTAPPVRFIWGLCFLREVSPSSFKGDSVTMESKGLPSFFFISRHDTARFDTSFKIPLTSLPIKNVRKQVEYCAEDGFRRVRYV